MRILVDHSGYDLLNMGDVAMLQACITRMQRRWPNATVEVVCFSPDRLAEFCPGTVPLGPDWANRPKLAQLPNKMRLGGEQAYKAVAPLIPIRSKSPAAAPSRSLRQAIAAADVVVASGGGYVCDPFWWHGVAVLSALRAAQRLGKPTAMFGQGIGPLTNRLLRRFAADVFSNLDLLTLREGEYGLDFLHRYGVEHTAGGNPVFVTGDDALRCLPSLEDLHDPELSKSIGINLRVSAYAGLSHGVGREFADTIWRFAHRVDAQIVALPVSTYSADADLPAIVRAMGHCPAGVDTEFISQVIASPGQLVGATVGCRAVVTGSYHAAVFALGNGVPVVALSASDYYDAKFVGLRNLYPGLVRLERLNAPSLSDRLDAALTTAWNLDSGARRQGRVRTAELVTLADNAFAKFAANVDHQLAKHQQT